VSYLVPDRVVDGYGLTPPDCRARGKASGADVLITVDNGIASVEGVAHANALGLQVLVTDHHLPGLLRRGGTCPMADVIVNPNQPGCTFESKAIAGVGVMFYVLLALRAELRQRGALTPQPAQAGRTAAAGGAGHGGRRGEAGRQQPPPGGAGPEARARRRHAAGLAALFAAAGRDARQTATTFDFGFALGPRINAAGRLSDMTLGIECLLTDDTARADELAARWTASTASAARSKATCASRPCTSPSLFDEGRRSPARHLRVRSGLSRRRGRHRGLTHQGQAASPHLCVCRQPGAGQGARAEGLRPLHPGLSPARRAGPGGQAPPRRAAALWRPRHGGWLHHGRRPAGCV
jgi:single-stranded-DNA-specific exonuclease